MKTHRQAELRTYLVKAEVNSSGVLYETPRLFLTTDASASIALLCRGVRFASGVKWCQNKTYHVRRAAPKNDGEAADRGGKMLQPSLIHQHVISLAPAVSAPRSRRRTKEMIHPV